MTLCAAYC